MLNEIVEFIAGREHYNNYKNYIKNGGLKSLLRQTGYSFKVISKNIGYASEIILAQPNG